MDAIKTGVTSRRNSTITEQDYKDLIEAVIYDQGNLYWLFNMNGRAKPGYPVHNKTDNSNQYRRIKFKGRKYYYHRVIFYMFYGYLPDYIDHKDGNKQNNRIENLRPSTQSLNVANTPKPKRKNATSIYKGVTFCKHKADRKHWKARSCIDGKYKHLGYFESEIEAAKAYDNFANAMFGDYARTNKMLGLL